MSTTEIENVLRRAPQPKPPGNLQQRLKAQALSAPRLPSPKPGGRSESGSWLTRWWPALAPTVISLACAATFTVQQQEARHLKAEVENSAAAAAAALERSAAAPAAATPHNASAAEEGELLRLRTLAASLNAEIAKLEQIQAENDRLRAQLASRSAAMFTQEEVSSMEQARERAMSIQCANNLKQLGLAVRVWSLDHQELSPPNILSMSNEIGSFKILVCPADAGRQAATDASTFTPANSSYEYLAPSAPDTEPQRIAFRCPIHGNLGLIDGSVQMGIVKNHPDWIVQRNGKLYLEAPSDVIPGAAQPEGTKQSQ